MLCPMIFHSADVQKEDPLPPWVRSEQGRALKEEGDGLPFGLYLLAASLVAIASVGSGSRNMLADQPDCKRNPSIRACSECGAQCRHLLGDV